MRLSHEEHQGHEERRSKNITVWITRNLKVFPVVLFVFMFLRFSWCSLCPSWLSRVFLRDLGGENLYNNQSFNTSIAK
jgi:hypothetical protein